ncbi:MAG: nucleotidyltransferase domain-containing protein [Ignavibacteriales bacterium]|nr:nucleotidyltransferase domain-containing protein [Ignavibacteriales bacterium]
MDKQFDREFAINKACELAVELKENNISIINMFLFGSFADDTQSDFEWSDIDIAIVSNDFSGSRFDDNLFLLPIVLKVDSRIETHPYTSADFEDSPFAKDAIIGKGIEISNVMIQNFLKVA